MATRAFKVLIALAVLCAGLLQATARLEAAIAEPGHHGAGGVEALCSSPLESAGVPAHSPCEPVDPCHHQHCVTSTGLAAPVEYELPVAWLSAATLSIGRDTAADLAPHAPATPPPRPAG